MKIDAENGWWEAPAGEFWICPECNKKSLIELWVEAFYYCEDCGDHDARECPECGERFDHVWGAEKIANTTKNSSC